jgi:hypothetical protein
MPAHGKSMFLMMALSTLLGFVVGVTRCPWSAVGSFKSLIQYAAVTVRDRGKIGSL